MDDEIGAQWDANAPSWASSLHGGLDRINERFGIPAFIGHLGALKDLRTLDAGCGEGRSARHLARAGAQVTGVDVSQAMITQAERQESESPLGIRYLTASCARLDMLQPSSFDLVTSFMALMDTPDLRSVFAQVHRVLVPGGRLAIMVRHPCFFTSGLRIQRSANAADNRLTVSEYFRGTPYTERWGFRGQSDQQFVVTRFPYTLSDYVSGLLGSGFEIACIDEPKPDRSTVAEMPNLAFWQRHAALYLFLLATKRGATA